MLSQHRQEAPSLQRLVDWLTASQERALPARPVPRLTGGPANARLTEIASVRLIRRAAQEPRQNSALIRCAADCAGLGLKHRAGDVRAA